MTSPSIPDTELNEAIILFQENDKMISATRLTKFFLGSKPFKRVNLSSSKLYRKYEGQLSEESLIEKIELYLTKNKINKKARPWDTISFFDKTTFNKHTYQTVEALKAEIFSIPLEKTTNLSEAIIKTRKTHPRAYENWSEKESELLLQALEKTNDLTLLSKWFKRGEKTIKTQGKKLIYQHQKMTKL